MMNVRLDDNGIPMGPSYAPTAPAAHRSGVTSVDASDPEGPDAGVDCAGWQHCRFDITIAGVAFESLEVQALFWNPVQEVWFGGGSRRFDATGRYALSVEARGAVVFLKVTAFSGTSFTLDADCVLS
jgi:hypothetical protein